MRLHGPLLLLGLILFTGCEIPLDKPKDRAEGSGRRDPVCGVTCLDDKCAKETWQRQEYSFCSKECQDKFRGEPDRYLRKP